MSYQRVLSQASALLEAQKQLAAIEAAESERKEKELQTQYIQRCVEAVGCFIPAEIMPFLVVESQKGYHSRQYTLSIPECTLIWFSLAAEGHSPKRVKYTVDSTPQLLHGHDVTKGKMMWIYNSGKEDHEDLLIAIAHANENFTLTKQFKAEIEAYEKEEQNKTGSTTQQEEIRASEISTARINAQRMLLSGKYENVIEICQWLLKHTL